MKKITCFVLLLAASLSTFAQTWKSDKAHSQLKFDITHMGISTISGEFKDFAATITASKADFSDAVFTLTAQTGSISTGVEMRDNHLKSPDFFDAATNTTLSFKSTSLTKTGEGKYKLTGDLTLHGVTKPVTLELWYRGTIENPMNKKPVAGFRATGTIKRSDFGIGGKFAPPMLSEEVAITADGEFGQ
ncbi:YceI family protein [Chitinophaga sp. GCM10012297]|uniref:YceI family protein n=1 Tax=Chitinophaga chungangae TaxID=2821488 RepID=A0ABS3YJW1_9BACT|nr:YceI family protein [Chitinophaga chungangae]MBO9154970.1 YceI family protein [Chitinophaga chungangae]